ncbi:hypothetical protein Tco_0631005 [Tanacetum coccineum]
MVMASTQITDDKDVVSTNKEMYDAKLRNGQERKEGLQKKEDAQHVQLADMLNWIVAWLSSALSTLTPPIYKFTVITPVSNKAAERDEVIRPCFVGVTFKSGEDRPCDQVARAI